MYDVVLADPPWQYRAWSGKESRTADSQYEVLTVEQICRLPVAPLLAKNCALFLWATPPAIWSARQVMLAWGFEYKTFAFVWVKHNIHPVGQKDYAKQEHPALYRTKPDVWGDIAPGAYGFSTGMGHYTRANVEVCLLGIRGSMPVEDRGIGQLLFAPRIKHSQKPDETYLRIQAMYPHCKYLELFARFKWPEWSSWGSEIQNDIELAVGEPNSGDGSGGGS